MKRFLALFLAFSIASQFFVSSALAQGPQGGGIYNPALSPEFSDPAAATSGELFAMFFIRFWNIIIIVGAFAFMINFIIASYEWLMSGSDKGKLQKSQERITQGLIGLIILVCSYTIIAFISYIAFGENFNILNPFENFSAGALQGGTQPPKGFCIGVDPKCANSSYGPCIANSPTCSWQTTP